MTAARPEPATGTKDLGVLRGPVLCFGGPYSNARATAAVLAEAERRGIPPGRVICTGDVVAYGAEPAETVRLVRDAGIHVAMGNCEESLGLGADDCGCGFETGSDCAEWSEAWYAFARARLPDDARAWMRALPRQLRFTLAGRRLAVIHGGDTEISQYVFASTPWVEKARILDRLGGAGPVEGVVAGHAGLPFTELVGDRLWHNAGAIGMPANDGTARTWFSVLQQGAQGITVTVHPLRYDHAAAARALEAAMPGLPYARSLDDGLWPNMAVLPVPERRRRGRPLAPEPVHWPAPAAAAAE